MTALLGTLLLAGTAAAQRPPELTDAAPLRRPLLAGTADTNSWTAYFDYGVAQLRAIALSAGAETPPRRP